MTPDELYETFALFDDWEQRYAFLIDLGRGLPGMDAALKTDDVLVPGCTSRVWLVTREINKQSDINLPLEGGGDDTCFHFDIDSDAAIVKGLCAVLMVFVQDKPVDVIRRLDMDAVFTRLNLGAHLSPNRRNGFFAMVERINQLAG